MDSRYATEAKSQTLESLLAGVVDPVLAEPERQRRVTGVFDDSRRVRPGGVFVAIRGTDVDGRRFVADAVGHGATVLIGEGLDPIADRVVINVNDARETLARLAARWHGLDDPQTSRLRLLGVTGTNGKTTTAYMTQAILHAADRRCGMVSTVQVDLCGHRVTASMTTPGALELAEHLRGCVDHGAEAAVIEVSSHALDQRRADGLRFDAAAFTNLTQDHLDYHKTFDAYRQAKARLFERLDETATAVVNRDDPNHEALIRACPARIVTYGLAGDADITATITRDTLAGTRYRLRIEERELVLENALVGPYNVYNALAAAGLARALDVSLDAIERGLAAVRHVPGRLQRVPGLRDIEVFVDYAHTDDALQNVARVLKPLTRRRLIVVFGCGGDRDRTKRPLMARAAAKYGDAVIVTSDNPRSEDPLRIIDDILPGFDEQTRRRVVVEPDRRAAIHAALAGATKGDVVLIAGKGHEDYQIVGRERLPFDDFEVASQAAAELQPPNGET